MESEREAERIAFSRWVECVNEDIFCILCCSVTKKMMMTFSFQFINKEMTQALFWWCLAMEWIVQWLISNKFDDRWSHYRKLCAIIDQNVFFCRLEINLNKLYSLRASFLPVIVWQSTMFANRTDLPRLLVRHVQWSIEFIVFAKYYAYMNTHIGLAHKWSISYVRKSLVT